MPDLNPAGWVASSQATNAAATASQAAPAAKKLVIFGVDASFSTPPAAPVLLQIKDGGTVIWQAFATQSLSRQFKRGIACTAGNGASAVLAAGGSGVTGSVNLDGVII